MSGSGLLLSILTAVVALYGAGLATYTAVTARRDKKRQVSVSLSLGVVAFAGGGTSSVVTIQASNPGERAVTLQPGTIILPNGWQIFTAPSHSSVRFPHELPEGKACSCWIETSELARHLSEQGYRGRVKLVGAFRNEIGAQYRSKAIKFHVEGWLKAG